MLTARYLAALLMVGTLMGCASTGDIKRLDGDIASLRSQVEMAQQDAEAARRSADEANTRSKMTEEMLNRGFKRSMYK